MSQFSEFITSFRLDPSYTVEADQAAAHMQPGVASSGGHPSRTGGDTMAETGAMVENSTATHGQVANAYEESMVDYYAYSQHGSSSVPDVPFHPSHPNVTNVPTQWQPPLSVFEHHGQPAPGPSSTANSHTHNNYPQAYAGATGASTGLPQEQQHHGSALVTMPGGFQFAIPVVVATVLMVSTQHHCGSCGSRPV